jgi:hypothetical protein
MEMSSNKIKENPKIKKKIAYTILISAISGRFIELALARYREWSEYSSAADNGGLSRSPNPSKLAKLNPFFAWAEFSHCSLCRRSGSLTIDINTGSKNESSLKEFLIKQN